MASLPVLMIGTGEYTTGYGAGSAKTDKAMGVVALTLLDLRKRGFCGELHLAGVNGKKLPAIREYMRSAIGGAFPGSDFDFTMSTYPADDAVDPLAYRAALAVLPRGSAAIIFTPDDTHFSIAMDCVAAGVHTLVTKPVVMTLAQHKELAAAASAAGVIVAVEVHKRWDPIYADARERARRLGNFSFLSSYMSQPKFQLETFRAWAGISSDISYYLNSHHVDFHEWCMEGRGRPLRVTGLGATGIASGILGRPCEDVISLSVEWENLPSRARGVASYTAAWSAPRGDVHSQQRFFYLGHGGEVTVDQAHRGYSTATDASGYASHNPLFFTYTPDAAGRFVGQRAYGYRSIEAFIDAAASVRSGASTARAWDEGLATIHCTLQGTAILEAGRRSLDAGGRPVRICYVGEEGMEPCGLEVEEGLVSRQEV